jgi:hypothetical protein
LTLQTPFDLGHQVCGEASVIERLFQDRGGVLRLAAVACEALLRCAVATLSGFNVVFGMSCGWGHGVLLASMCICGGRSLSKRT